MSAFCPSRILTYIIAFAILSLPGSMHAQNQTTAFSDGFEDGSFLSNPPWSGDTDQFEISERAENHLLKLKGLPDGGTSCLATQSTNATGLWEFFTELDFSPSGSNNATIFLVADRMDLRGAVNGYAIRYGESGSNDTIKLLRFDDGVANVMLSDTTDVSEGGGFRILVNRYPDGRWTLATASGYHGQLTTSPNTAVDSTYTRSAYFGICASYTSTRRERMWFDFAIQPPLFEIRGLEAINSSAIRLAFSSPPDRSSINTDDFELSRFGKPASIAWHDDRSLNLRFETEFGGGPDTLFVDAVSGRQGQLLQPEGLPIMLWDGWTDGDIVLNELLFDPPEGHPEYIELFNRTGKWLNAAELHLSDASGSSQSPIDSIALKPHGYLVLTDDTAAYSGIHPAYWPDLPSLNNGGDSITVSAGDSLALDHLRYEGSWGIAGRALERRDPSAPTPFPANWAASLAAMGTPGSANSLPPDTLPPQLIHLSPLDDRHIELMFSEALHPERTQKYETIILNPDPGIRKLELGTSKRLHIRLDHPLMHATNYSVSINGLPDIFGNKRMADTSFVYYETTNPEPGSLVINEIMYDPPPGWTEYIELYNADSLAVDLAQLQISDATGTSALAEQRILLPPQSRMVLAPDSSLLGNHQIPFLLSPADGWRSLNNGGDAVVLSTKSSRTIDSLYFYSEWGGDERSLERRSLDVAARYAVNWRPSPEPYTGSPGRANRVLPDTTAPRLHSTQIFNSSALKLSFSEPLDPTIAHNAEHYLIQPGMTTDRIDARGNTVYWFFEKSFTAGSAYSITIRQVGDLFGNRMTTARDTVRYYRFGTARKHAVVINEFRPEGAEFVELFNTTDTPLDLRGWTLRDGSSGILKFPEAEDFKLPGRSYLVVSKLNMKEAFRPADWPGFNQRGDQIVLTTGAGRVIDSLRYHSRWPLPENGRSIERIDPMAPSADPSNWAPLRDAEHTAGNRNKNYQPDHRPPQVVFAGWTDPSHAEVHFDEFVQTDAIKVSVDNEKVAIDTGRSALSNSVLVTLGEAIGQNSAGNRMVIEELRDGRGNRAERQTIPLAMPPLHSELVVTEIMPRPVADHRDGLPDQTEYLEVYNRSDRALSLQGLRFHDAPDEHGRIDVQHPEDDRLQWLAPGQRLLLYPDTVNTFSRSRIAKAFSIADTVKALRFDGVSLGLTFPETLVLTDSTGRTIDSLRYRENWHNPNLPDTRGRSLEKIRPAASSNPSTWTTSANPNGGTPGRVNSVRADERSAAQTSTLSLSPNPFSPDHDGFEDHLVLRYRLDEADYVLRVRIYDRHGRRVRTLTDGKPAGRNGRLIWDGLTDEGHRNRIGIYVILFEAFDSANGRRVTIKKPVVLARQL